MITVNIPIREGNDALRSGKLQNIMGQFMEQQKPEAAYFTTNDDGERSAVMVFDLADPADIPRIAEPLFQELGARVKFKPCMNADDLRRGLSQLDRAVATTLN
jgi:hypothetical protein